MNLAQKEARRGESVTLIDMDAPVNFNKDEALQALEDGPGMFHAKVIHTEVNPSLYMDIRKNLIKYF